MNLEGTKIALINGKVFFPKKDKILQSNLLIIDGILKEVDSKKITLQHSSGKVVQVSISKVEQATAKLNWQKNP